MNLLGENRKNLGDLRLGKAQPIKEYIDKPNFIKIKMFSLKDIVWRIQRWVTNWGKNIWKLLKPEYTQIPEIQ